jgi:hypothetical protein
MDNLQIPEVSPPITPREWLRRLDRRYRLRFSAAALALAAGFSHALAGEEHFTIWWGYGLFFSIVSICQIMGGGALLFWGNRGLCWVGVVGTSLVMGLYVMTRTVGVPFGPEAGVVEGVGVLDAFTKTFELGLLICLVAMLRLPEGGDGS